MFLDAAFQFRSQVEMACASMAACLAAEETDVCERTEEDGTGV